MKTRPMVKADDITETPSHDFLKWLSDSLKGLNSSVNGMSITCTEGYMLKFCNS